ncbi:uncharacterized protein V6R79_023456 [Siganus canaliculatus]
MQHVRFGLPYSCCSNTTRERFPDEWRRRQQVLRRHPTQVRLPGETRKPPKRDAPMLPLPPLFNQEEAAAAAALAAS